MEFSKKLLYFSWAVTLVLTIVAIVCSIQYLPTDIMSIVLPLTWAETATATGYYYWKSKNENRAKYAQKFLKNMAKEWGPDVAVRISEVVLKD